MKNYFFYIFILTLVLSCDEAKKDAKEIKTTKISFYANDSLSANEAFITIYDKDTSYSIKSLEFDSSNNNYARSIIIKSDIDSLILKKSFGFFSYDTVISNNDSNVVLRLENLMIKHINGESLINVINRNPDMEIRLSYSGCFYHKFFRLFYSPNTNKVDVVTRNYEGSDTTFKKSTSILKSIIISAIKKQELHLSEKDKKNSNQQKKEKVSMLTDCFSLSTNSVGISIKIKNYLYSFFNTIYCGYDEIKTLEKELASICNHNSYLENQHP